MARVPLEESSPFLRSVSPGKRWRCRIRCRTFGEVESGCLATSTLFLSVAALPPRGEQELEDVPRSGTLLAGHIDRGLSDRPAQNHDCRPNRLDTLHILTSSRERSDQLPGGWGDGEPRAARLPARSTASVRSATFLISNTIPNFRFRRFEGGPLSK